MSGREIYVSTMQEVWNAFSSPSWWVLAVFVSLLVNLGSAYLKAPIDSLLSSLFKAWRERTTLARIRHQQHIERLSKSKDLQYLHSLDALRLRAKSTWWLIVLAILTVLYVADLNLRAIEIIATQKLPSPEFFVQGIRGALVFFSLVALANAMRFSMDATELEQDVKAAQVQQAKG
jgi:hypothetical protein